MPDNTNFDKLPDVDRLSAWRNQRLEKAEAEKKERLRAKALERQSEQEQQKILRLQAAKALLPTDAELAIHEDRLLDQAKRNSGRIFLQFFLCVLVPLAAGIYYQTTIATQLYQAQTVVLVSKVSGTSESQQTGLLNSLTSPPNLREAFMADAFIQSPTMIEHLEAEAGLLERWSSEKIDPLQRLRTIETVGLTKEMQSDRFLESRVDVQTGLLTIEVRDPEPATATQTASLVIALTQQRLKTLNEQQYSTQIARANVAVDDAKEELISAQAALAASQLASGEVDPRLSVDGVYEAIRLLEAQALELENEVNLAQISGRAESYVAQRTKELAERTREEISGRRSLLVVGVDGKPSLSNILMDHERLSLQVAIAEKALESAFANLAAATTAAAQNQSLLQVIVPPVANQSPSHPKGASSLILIAVISLSLFAFLRLIQVGRTE